MCSIEELEKELGTTGSQLTDAAEGAEYFRTHNRALRKLLGYWLEQKQGPSVPVSKEAELIQLTSAALVAPDEPRPDKRSLPEATSVADLIPDYEKQQQYLRSRCYIDGEDLVLKPVPWDEYVIALSRLDTPTKLLFWIDHLSSKRWMDLELLDFFITLVVTVCGKKDEFDWLERC